MKSFALLLAGTLAHSAFADSSGKDIFVSAVIGAVSIIGLILLVGTYRLGKFVALKLRPTTSLALQRTSGVMFVFAFFLLISAFGK